MLYVARHGQTVWNIEKRYQGQQDSPLSELGTSQAQATASFLASQGIAKLYASPLGRAWVTAGFVADAISRARIPDDRLKECGFGVCEGMSQREIDIAYPGMTAWRDADKWNRNYPGAETYREVTNRVSDFANDKVLEALRVKSPTTAVIAHDMVNRCLVGHIANWSQAQIMAEKQENNEIFLVSHEKVERIIVSGNGDLVSAKTCQ